ncbi:MAG: tetratricopeptide repeat protein, partial [Candidatus Omnitrophica bacterium]|nr:tetratricopeptide repeat protein [Candidatus Omnitrophota bacterium]
MNNNNIGIRFSVVDKGVPGTNTSAILSRLEQNIDEYRPHMVISMMGINDPNPHLSYEDSAPRNTIAFLDKLRVFRLGKLVYLSSLARIRAVREAHGPESNAEEEKGQGSLRIEKGYTDSELRLQEVLATDPENLEVLLELGVLYREQGRFLQAEKIFKKLIEIDPQEA